MKSLNLNKSKTPAGKKITLIASIAFIAIMLVVTYFPIFYLMAYSFTESPTIGKWTGFSIALYIKVFSNKIIMIAFVNSLIIGIVSATLATMLGTLASVGIFYMRKVPKTISNGITQITMVNADIVTGVAFMLFFMMIKIVPDGYVALILSHTMICIPYVIMSVAPRLSQLNQNVYEAGLDLGASHLRTLFKVVIPQLTGGMIAGFMLAFTISFDDFTISKWFSGDVKTIPLYLYNSTKGPMPREIRALSTLLVIIITAILVGVNVIQAKRIKKTKMLKLG